MRLLLDTQVALRLLDEPGRIGSKARASLYEADVNLISVVSFIEVGIKAATGKLRVPTGFRDSIPNERVLALAPEHGLALEHLPLHHRDPFDRLLIAQARAEGLAIVTSDSVFTAYDVAVVDARR